MPWSCRNARTASASEGITSPSSSANVDAAPPRQEVVRGRVEVPAAVAKALVEVVALVRDEQIGLDERADDGGIEAVRVRPFGGRQREQHVELVARNRPLHAARRRDRVQPCSAGRVRASRRGAVRCPPSCRRGRRRGATPSGEPAARELRQSAEPGPPPGPGPGGCGGWKPLPCATHSRTIPCGRLKSRPNGCSFLSSLA